MKKFRGVFIKNSNEIALMREANHIVYTILQTLRTEIHPGTPTMRFEEIAQDLCRQYKVRPAFQGYNGFPFALCCSVNEEVIHGFPSARRLREGDIVSFDMGVVVEGFYGDAARTYPVGCIAAEAERLLRCTAEALEGAAAVAIEGSSLLSICAMVQKKAEEERLGIVKRFVGHGVGVRLHEKPEIPNFVSPHLQDLPLQAGMVLAIEPMFSLGDGDVRVLQDGWTAATKDGSLSAHFEHSVLVGATAAQILDC
ncbi:MAG: type I methionyl aminopeptidase [Deltaproteobacteria bacterium]|jgi:methionyl aminopeptidase|nr:type I methionyl aminopeptidase [Deltaproteobacteria bacterium]